MKCEGPVRFRPCIDDPSMFKIHYKLYVGCSADVLCIVLRYAEKACIVPIVRFIRSIASGKIFCSKCLMPQLQLQVAIFGQLCFL